MSRLPLRWAFGFALSVCGLLATLAVQTSRPLWAAPPDKVDVIITFKAPPGQAQQGLVRALGGTVKATYSIIPAIAASVPSTAIQGLQRHPLVDLVEPDIQVQALDLPDGNVADPDEVKNAWGVDRLDARLVWGTGNTGAGVGIAICDTGSGPHPELLNILNRYNCLSGACVADPNAIDGNGHGSHVAGTAAAVFSGGSTSTGVAGVAPGAALFSYQVLNASGSGSYSNVIAALNHIVQYNAGAGVPEIRVASFSLGSTGNPGSAVEAAFNNAYNAGVLCVVAAGNTGRRNGNGDTINYPARYGTTVAVGATDASDKRASFSSTGPGLDLAAPGVSIRSCWKNNGYATISGTSMATPHVSGAAALLFAQNPGWSPLDVRTRLELTARDLGAAGSDSLYGKGLVSPTAATGTSNPTP